MTNYTVVKIVTTSSGTVVHARPSYYRGFYDVRTFEPPKGAVVNVGDVINITTGWTVLSENGWSTDQFELSRRVTKREVSELVAKERTRHSAKELLAALELFERCAYPVCQTINPRGHNWMPEAALDYALGQARAAIAKAKGQ